MCRKKVWVMLIFLLSISCDNAVYPQQSTITDRDKKAHIAFLALLADRYKMLLTSEKTMGQTEAFLAQARNIADLDTHIPAWREQKYIDIIQKIMARERIYQDTHYAFYHGMSKQWLLPQDLYGLLYEHAHKTRLQNFRFLRFTKPQPEQTAGHFLLDAVDREGWVHDEDPYNKIRLLSVNITPFGNVTMPWESTFFYFMGGHISKRIFDTSVIKSIIQSYGIDSTIAQKYTAFFDDLRRKYLSNEPGEMILQILVPKKLVDDMGYMAWLWGIPFKPETISLLFKLANQSGYAGITDHAQGQILHLITMMRAQVAHNKQEKDELKQVIRDGAFKISPYINIWTSPRAALLAQYNLNWAQERLLFTNPYFFEPTSGITMFAYTLIPADTFARYTSELQALVSSMLNESGKKI
jgi:hypothetical protein